MKIYLKRTNQAVRFEATNERGHTVSIEGSKDIGGEDSAPSPTELLLMSQAGCTAIDVVELLRKMRQPLEHLEIETEGSGPRTRCQKFLHTYICITNYMVTSNLQKQKKQFQCQLKSTAR